MEIVDVGVLCNGIKEGRYGLAMAKCSGNVAAVFTRNSLRAAPVVVCEEHVSDGRIEGLIVNSGNANAFTGEEGYRDAKEMCEIAASLLGCDARDIAVASTGVIGRRLDMDWIRRSAAKVAANLGSSYKHAENFARAITTTDRFIKKASHAEAKIAAVAKGAGMIAPNMATMLCFIFTTASFDSGELYEMLKDAVDASFNRLTVDGDTSTNDTVLLVSTMKENVPRDVFEEGLREVCLNLAHQIARDGEGATRVFRVRVLGAESEEEANTVAKAVASSLLVKTAVFGRDPNWGRIVAAVGYSTKASERLSICFRGDEEVWLVVDGRATGREEDARKLMERCEEFEILVDLNKGGAEGLAIGCDLSYDYVRLNSSYTT
ncbi:MAG: bifunctional ornithine acetyltransferase/N-acetylglutamate synthase [Archaeoglobaceae archaeon]